MNAFGYRWQDWLLRPLHWLRYRWQTIRYGNAAARLWLAGVYLGMACRVLFYGR